MYNTFLILYLFTSLYLNSLLVCLIFFWKFVIPFQLYISWTITVAEVVAEAFETLLLCCRIKDIHIVHYFGFPKNRKFICFVSFIVEHDVYVCSLNTSTAYAKNIMFILIIYVIHIHLDTCIDLYIDPILKIEIENSIWNSDEVSTIVFKFLCNKNCASIDVNLCTNGKFIAF